MTITVEVWVVEVDVVTQIVSVSVVELVVVM